MSLLDASSLLDPNCPPWASVMSQQAISVSVDEYAEKMKVTTTYEDWSRAWQISNSLDEEATQRVRETAEQMKQASRQNFSVSLGDLAAKRVFYEELMSKHLPVVVEAFRSSLIGPGSMLNKRQHFLSVHGCLFHAATLEGSAAFYRYARDHPESKGLLSDLLDVLPDVLPAVKEFGGTWGSGLVSVQCADHLNNLVELLSVLLHLCPSAPAIIALPRPALKDQIYRLSHDLRELSPTRGMEKLREDTRACLQLIYSALSRRSVNKIKNDMASNLKTQIRFHLRCPFSLRGNCIEGERMVCSKCLAVSYCGKAHQVEHWPTHMKTCFKPYW